jgi:DNA polymerase-3 subunit epsilon
MHKILKDIPKLVGIDLETTGSSFSDRIVEIALVSYRHGQWINTTVERVNPGIPIPPAVTKIHGITDQDVAGKPRFSEFAHRVLEILSGATLFGYNVIFDFNVLTNEWARAGVKPLDRKSVVMIDAFVIWKKQDPKSLTHAYKHFCGKDLEGAHGALADIQATFEVLDSQLHRFSDLPQTQEELGTYCYPGDPSWVCSSYHFIWNDHGTIVCNFGKTKGIPLEVLAREQTSFCHWVLDKEFPNDVKILVQKALDGKPLPVKAV